MRPGNFMTTGIGSLPYTDPKEAVDFVLAHVDVPFWPQLPRRGFLENMYAQFSEMMPCAAVNSAAGTMWMDTKADNAAAMVSVLNAYMEGSSARFQISPDHAASLPEFLGRRHSLSRFPFIKGQVTGPISFGLQVCDQGKRPVLYDDMAFDAAVKTLALKAKWQAEKLAGANRNAILFVDEPFLSAMGSAYVHVESARVVECLDEVFSLIPCLKAVHCCGNTDWPLIMRTRADIISLDAYNYGESFILYAKEIKAFLERGGIISWGIIPASKDALKESAASLSSRLDALMRKLSSKGISMETIRERSMLTPSCGTGSLDVATSERIFELLGEVAGGMR